MLLDHVDAWLFQQRSLVNARAKTLLPVLVQRQALADHLTRLLDKLGLDRVAQKIGSGQTAVIILPDNGRDQLPSGGDKLGLDRVSQKVGSVGKVVIEIPDNGRDQLPSGGSTNGPHPAHGSREPESTSERAIVELPPRDVGEVMSANEDQRHDDDLNDLERELGLQ